VLNELTSTPPRPKVRKPTWHRRLAALATKLRELSGLAGDRPCRLIRLAGSPPVRHAGWFHNGFEK
jgi:hypothetical protein